MGRVEQEVMALRRMALRDIYGESIAYAFGIGETSACDYLFEVAFDKRSKTLRLTIDAYRWKQPEGDFDVDAWEVAMVHLTGTGNDLRALFYTMSQVARALLSGRAVTLPNGETVELNQWRIQ